MEAFKKTKNIARNRRFCYFFNDILSQREMDNEGTTR